MPFTYTFGATKSTPAVSATESAFLTIPALPLPTAVAAESAGK